MPIHEYPQQTSCYIALQAAILTLYTRSSNRHNGGDLQVYLQGQLGSTSAFWPYPRLASGQELLNRRASPRLVCVMYPNTYKNALSVAIEAWIWSGAHTRWNEPKSFATALHVLIITHIWLVTAEHLAFWPYPRLALGRKLLSRRGRPGLVFVILTHEYDLVPIQDKKNQSPSPPYSMSRLSHTSNLSQLNIRLFDHIQDQRWAKNCWSKGQTQDQYVWCTFMHSESAMYVLIYNTWISRPYRTTETKVLHHWFVTTQCQISGILWRC